MAGASVDATLARRTAQERAAKSAPTRIASVLAAIEGVTAAPPEPTYANATCEAEQTRRSPEPAPTKRARLAVCRR